MHDIRPRKTDDIYDDIDLMAEVIRENGTRFIHKYNVVYLCILAVEPPDGTYISAKKLYDFLIYFQDMINYPRRRINSKYMGKILTDVGLERSTSNKYNHVMYKISIETLECGLKGRGLEVYMSFIEQRAR